MVRGWHAGVLAAALALVSIARAGGPSGLVVGQPPPQADPSAFYLFYLHGQIVEEKGERATHPRFGVYEYRAILDALAARGLVVISEARPRGTDIAAYAETVAGQVRALRAGGVPAEHITVAGHSKGGAIAIAVSSQLGDPAVGYVILASCGSWLEAPDAPRLSGRVLSIVEASDDVAGSCAAAFARAREGTRHEELILRVGGGHGAFYRPLAEWVEPLVQWTRQSP